MLDHWPAVLGAIIDGPRAWSTAAEVAEGAGLEPSLILDVLCDLALNGMAAAWSPRPGVEGWTLTPLSAEGLQVSLYEYDITGRCRWRRRGEALRARRAFPSDPPPDPAAVPDPSPGPAERAEAADDLKRWRPRGPLRVEHLPRPAVVLTGCKVAWDEAPGFDLGARLKTLRPRRSKRKPVPKFQCTACNGARLAPSHYCLRCDRWGLDGLVAAHRRAGSAAAKAREAG